MKDIQGKLVILLIFGVALAGAVFAIAFKRARDRRVLEFWGADAAELINRQADAVHLLVLGDRVAEAASTDNLPVDDQPRKIVRDVDISQARGLINFRYSFVDDPSFAWAQERGDCRPQWEYALRFQRESQVATLVIDTHCQRARLLETGTEASIAPMFRGLMKFIDENLAERKTSGSSAVRIK